MFLTRYPTRPTWNRLAQLHHAVNSQFDPWGTNEAAVFPAINVFEDADAYHLEAEVPGLDLADLELTVTGPNQFTLKGERKATAREKSTVHRQERVTGTFLRSVKLPAMIDADHVEAKLENGILRVRLPKHEQVKPRKIAVKS
jgi:HSP20 family protein